MDEQQDGLLAGDIAAIDDLGLDQDLVARSRPRSAMP